MFWDIFCPPNLPELQGHLLGQVRLQDASLTAEHPLLISLVSQTLFKRCSNILYIAVNCTPLNQF